MTSVVITNAERAARAELAWRDAEGRLRAAAFVPLVIDGAVAAALPFSESAVVASLADVGTATLAFTDSRMAWKGWSPLVVEVAVEVTADRTGEWTWTGALDQEVRKHPPARLLVDTAIQRREHWWYVPRWVVLLRPRGAAAAVARRQGPHDGLLVTAAGDAPSVRPVAVDRWDATEVEITPLAEATAWPPAGTTAALLFGHDFAIPDQERSSAVRLRGVLDGRVLSVEEREGSLDLPLPGLLRSLRRHRDLERACRRALAAYDASPSAAAT
ncbi:MAG TPA: hypothetical protein VFZ70_04830 [Euzebyales bacterium]